VRRGVQLALLCAGALAACGRYGPPVRSIRAEAAPPAATRPAEPAATPNATPQTPAPQTPAEHQP
jgi:hypothetical protein